MSDGIKRIGRYEISHTIGCGGFSTVYLGRDPYINRPVALKVSSSTDSSAAKSALAKLFQEAEAAGGLIHPNIVTIYDAGIHDGSPYIAMEYVEGTTLVGNTTEGNLLSVADAIDCMIKVCHALDYAHQRGVIHRDVKPGNILMGTNGEVKIADFGLACFKELALCDTKTVGTPSYMPPEQVAGRGSTPRSDLFSVGVVLYRLLCGAKPFEGADSVEMRRNILEKPHVPLASRRPDLPPELFAVIDRALSKDPEKRQPSGFDLARDLEAILHGSGCRLSSEIEQHVYDLRTLAFFEDFTAHETARILTIGAWLKHKGGETIIREEDPGGSFFVIVSGETSVSVGGTDLGKLSRGESFGEIAFLLGRRRAATIRALSDTNLLKLNPEKIGILELETQVKLYRLFARTIASYLLKAEGLT